MDFEIVKTVPAYAENLPKPGEIRILRFENDSRLPVEKEMARFGLRVVQAWADQPSAAVAIDQKGNLMFLARPGATIFAFVKSA